MSVKSLRNWLNWLFMLVACVGLYFYLSGQRDTGTYIILCSFLIKFTELALRMLKL